MLPTSHNQPNLPQSNLPTWDMISVRLKIISWWLDGNFVNLIWTLCRKYFIETRIFEVFTFCTTILLELQGHEVAEWRRQQPYVEWGEKAMQAIWPDLTPTNRDAFWTLESDAWGEVASSQRYVRSPIESMPRRIRSVFDAQGFCTSY
jgi:hypothetical protein